MSHKGDGQSVVARRTTTKDLPNGKTLELSQLTLKDYTTLREKACSEYKRSFLLTYTENADLLPQEQRATLIADKFKEAEAITPDDLPSKKTWVAAKDADGKPITHGGERFYHDGARAWINPGDPVPELKDTDYASWWSSSTILGRMHTLWLSVRHSPGQQNITLDELIEMFRDEKVLDDFADQVGELSRQRLGNAVPPRAA